MSDYDDFDYERRDEKARSKGLSAETVLAIRQHVLGDYTPPAGDTPSLPNVPDVAAGAPRSGGKFPKGRSGNPKGRPKKLFTPAAQPTQALSPKDLLAPLAMENLDKKLWVIQEGERVKLSMAEVMIQKQTIAAAKGSTPASKFLHSLSRHAQAQQAQAEARNYAEWRDRKARYTAIHERERKSGRSLFWGCPHPDDIILGPGTEVRVDGPMDPEALAATRLIYERTPYWCLLMAYDSWLQKRRRRVCPACPHATAPLVSHALFHAEQALLPKRLQLSADDLAATLEEHSQLAGRALHDALRAEAATLGYPVPPRALRIPFTLAAAESELLFPELSNDPHTMPVLSGDAGLDVLAVLHVAWGATMREQVGDDGGRGGLSYK